MKGLKQLLLSILAVLLLGAAASANTFFVSTSGSDSNAGSSSLPWRTIQHAVDTIAAGDTIIVQPGAYAGCRISRSGAASGACTLRAASPGSVLINSLSSANRHQSLIEIENFDATIRYWVIDGFEVAGAQRYGIDLRDTDFVTVQNCVVHNSTVTGIFLAFCYHPLIQNNESHSNGEHGIYQSNSGDFPTIRGNRLHNNAAAGLHMNGDRNFTPGDGVISFALVEKNVVWENGLSGGSGINCDGVSDSTIQNNLLYNNHASGISLYAIDGAQGSSRNRVYNNTIVMAGDGRWCINIPPAGEGQTNPVGNKIKNNILYTPHSFRGSISTYGSAVSAFEADYNVVVGRFSTDDGNTSLSLSQWQAFGYDQHSVIATPSQLFANASGNDYTLRVASPAIDAGTLLVEVIDDIAGLARPQGTRHDIGCYEAAATGAPAADFIANPLSGTAPLTVQFTDRSSGPPTSWAWEFGDGGLSSLQNPSHVYQTSGTFTVKLTVSNAVGQDSRTMAALVTASPPPSAPVADFTASPLSGSAPLRVQFTDVSTAAATWFWEFGDASNSTERNPVHTYQTAGSFTVRLTVSNAIGQNVKTRAGYVTVDRAPAFEFFCTSLSVDAGRLRSGNHTSVHSSDDSYLVLRSSLLDGKMGDMVTYVFETGSGSMSSLEITLESRFTLLPERQRIMLFNVTTASWDLVDDRTITGAGDLTMSVPIANPTSYVTGSGRVRLRVRSGDVGGERWKHFVDLVKITVTI
jgi:parallel beta-helix repeat protein